MSSSAVVSAQAVSVVYGDKFGIQDIDFSVDAGEIVSVIGPNGAGKTTLVECIIGLRKRAAGHIEVFGLDPAVDRQHLAPKIGVQLQATSYPSRSRVSELCRLFSSFYKDPQSTDELLQQFGIHDKLNSYASDLSGGERQRLSLALALVGRPQLLFLDELTTGLDPSARRSTWGLLRDLNEQGVSIVLTSHFMDEVQELSHRVVLLQDGRVRMQGSVSDFLTTSQHMHEFVLEFDGARDLVSAGLPASASIESAGSRVRVVGARDETRHALRELVEENGMNADDVIRHRPPNLEDAYLNLTNDSKAAAHAS